MPCELWPAFQGDVCLRGVADHRNLAWTGFYKGDGEVCPGGNCGAGDPIDSGVLGGYRSSVPKGEDYRKPVSIVFLNEVKDHHSIKDRELSRRSE